MENEKLTKEELLLIVKFVAMMKGEKIQEKKENPTAATVRS